MRSLNLIIAVVAAGLCMSLASAQAAPQPVISMLTNAHFGAVEDVGWRRRYYRGWGYPYAYYPPAYGYYYPPPASGYYAPAYPAYPYYAPYRYYRPYYAPYY
jgi:hypothetical protein